MLTPCRLEIGDTEDLEGSGAVVVASPRAVSRIFSCSLRLEKCAGGDRFVIQNPITDDDSMEDNLQNGVTI